MQSIKNDGNAERLPVLLGTASAGLFRPRSNKSLALENSAPGSCDAAPAFTSRQRSGCLDENRNSSEFHRIHDCTATDNESIFASDCIINLAIVIDGLE